MWILYYVHYTTWWANWSTTPVPSALSGNSSPLCVQSHGPGNSIAVLPCLSVCFLMLSHFTLCCNLRPWRIFFLFGKIAVVASWSRNYNTSENSGRKSLVILLNHSVWHCLEIQHFFLPKSFLCFPWPVLPYAAHNLCEVSTLLSSFPIAPNSAAPPSKLPSTDHGLVLARILFKN